MVLGYLKGGQLNASIGNNAEVLEILMRDFDERIRSFSDLDRIPLINALISCDAEAKSIAKAGSRAKRNSPARYRAEEARSQIDRFGRIIYFLRFRSPASGATVADQALCDMLAKKLEAKGQWVGEYSI